MTNQKRNGSKMEYLLLNKLNQIELMVAKDFQAYFEDFRAIDYREYIDMPLDGFKVIWKHNRVYYNKVSDLFAVIKDSYGKNKDTLNTLLNNSDRQREMWQLGIQLIYVVFKPSINKYITCEGRVLTGDSLSLVRGNPADSKMLIKVRGESVVFSRAWTTYNAFIEETDDMTSFMHLDRFYGNCGVDNLVIADKSKATKGSWG